MPQPIGLIVKCKKSAGGLIGMMSNDGHEDLWVGCGPIEHPDSNIFTDSPSEQLSALFLWTEDGFVDVAPDWGVDRTNNTRGGGFVDINLDGCAEEVARVPEMVRQKSLSVPVPKTMRGWMWAG